MSDSHDNIISFEGALNDFFAEAEEDEEEYSIHYDAMRTVHFVSAKEGTDKLVALYACSGAMLETGETEAVIFFTASPTFEDLEARLNAAGLGSASGKPLVQNYSDWAFICEATSLQHIAMGLDSMLDVFDDYDDILAVIDLPILADETADPEYVDNIITGLGYIANTYGVELSICVSDRYINKYCQPSE